ncbi:MAG TPA: AI-2E family transporter [Acidimicrobiia bacterium]|nr:AI-2E family transporter [Acidimicrobiia bacterium]HZQ79656.1 AI-2E family transporter [Acidimicrobiia bacterium]
MNPSGPRHVPAWLETATAIAWRVVAVVAAGFLIVLALSRLTVVVVPVIGALFVSAILVPPARWLRRRGCPALLATWAVFLSAVAIVVGIGAWLVPRVADQWDPLRQSLAQNVDDTRNWLIDGPLHLSPSQVDRYASEAKDIIAGNRGSSPAKSGSGASGGATPPASTPPATGGSGGGGSATSGSGGGGSSAGSAAGSGLSTGAVIGGRILRGAASGLRLLVHLLAALILTLVISFFFVKDGSAMSDWFLDQLQPSSAATVRAIGTRSWLTLTGYVRGTAVNGLVNATLMSIGLLILHVPLVPVIAVLTFFGGFFPIVGAFVSGGVAAAVALVAKSPATALLVVGLTVIIHHVEGYLVGPIVLGRAVRLHTVVVLLALAAGGELAGVLGAFVAVPLTAVIVGIVDELRHGEAARAASASAASTAATVAAEAPAPRIARRSF